MQISIVLKPVCSVTITFQQCGPSREEWLYKASSNGTGRPDMKLSFSHRGLAMPGSTCCLAIWIRYVDASIIRRLPWQLPGRLSRWSADRRHKTGRITDWNPSATRMLGWTRKQCVGRCFPVEFLVAVADRDRSADRWNPLFLIQAEPRPHYRRQLS